MWPQIRAGLIAVAIFFGLVDGCPLPPRGVTPEWEKGFVEPIRDLQHALLVPVRFIPRALLFSGRWALYQAPGGQRYRLTIEGRLADQSWAILYRAGDPDHADDAGVIESARVWGTWDPTPTPSEQYNAWVTWLALREFDRHPEILALRVRQEKIEIIPGGFTSSGQYAFEIARERFLR